MPAMDNFNPLRDAIPVGEIRRALVIKLRHHGDVLVSSPVFSVLKAHAPQAEIDALVYADTAEMVTLHPAVAQVHTIDRKWKQLGVLGQARAERAASVAVAVVAEAEGLLGLDHPAVGAPAGGGGTAYRLAEDVRQAIAAAADLLADLIPKLPKRSAELLGDTGDGNGRRHHEKRE